MIKTKKIVGLMRNIPKAEFSHNAAYAKIWASLVDADVDTSVPVYDTDITYLYIDINYKGSLNLFDGVSEDIYNRTNNFLNYKGELYIVDHEMPDIGDLILKRINNPSTFEKVTVEFCKALSEKCKTVKTVKLEDYINDRLVIGDSHSMSFTPVNTPVLRLDGKTLFGALKGNFINDLIPKSVNKLTLMFGSIDIRHHLLRQENPKESLIKLLNSYIEKIDELKKLGIDVEVCSPVPIENEDRKMASTSLYKKTEFFGSRLERLELTKFFINYLIEKNINIITYPLEWYDLEPLEFSQNYMEKPRGVHIGWPYYRINNFGLDYKKEEKQQKVKKQKKEEKIITNSDDW